MFDKISGYILVSESLLLTPIVVDWSAELKHKTFISVFKFCFSTTNT